MALPEKSILVCGMVNHGTLFLSICSIKFIQPSLPSIRLGMLLTMEIFSLCFTIQAYINFYQSHILRHLTQDVHTLD
jgi:hypothetical protein